MGVRGCVPELPGTGTPISAPSDELPLLGMSNREGITGCSMYAAGLFLSSPGVVAWLGLAWPGRDRLGGGAPSAISFPADSSLIRIVMRGLGGVAQVTPASFLPPSSLRAISWYCRPGLRF